MNLGLGYSEIALILLVALIVIGPRRLPELLRNVGKIMGQLRRASDDLRREILFSDEIQGFKDTIKDAMDPTEIPPVPPRIKTKPPRTPGDDENAAETAEPEDKPEESAAHGE